MCLKIVSVCGVNQPQIRYVGNFIPLQESREVGPDRRRGGHKGSE